VFSENIDLQRSASLTFAEITERGMFFPFQECLGVERRGSGGAPFKLQ
jgi:hypothetical protein